MHFLHFLKCIIPHAFLKRTGNPLWFMKNWCAGSTFVALGGEVRLRRAFILRFVKEKPKGVCSSNILLCEVGEEMQRAARTAACGEGRRASGLQRGGRRLAARGGGNVRPVALCKPSGEQPPRASPCFHLTEAPRRLMQAWRRVAPAAAGRIMGVHAQLDMRSHTDSKVHTRLQSGYFQDHLIKSQWVRLTHQEVLCCLYGRIDSVQCFG